MNLYICEICGDAFIGTEKPSDCPFCGSKSGFIRPGNEAKPITNEKIEISEVSLKNLEETLKLEINAAGIYQCMAEQADTYEVKAMYKRLVKVEMEHATIVCKITGLPKPEIKMLECSQDDVENFKKTVELEDHAVSLYQSFAEQANERNIKRFFMALSQVEAGHAELIKKYL